MPAHLDAGATAAAQRIFDDDGVEIAAQGHLPAMAHARPQPRVAAMLGDDESAEADVLELDPRRACVVDEREGAGGMDRRLFGAVDDHGRMRGGAAEAIAK